MFSAREASYFVAELDQVSDDTTLLMWIGLDNTPHGEQKL